MQLTDEQNEIIQAKLAHTVITAVAGSGKTTTLTHRILHLLEQGLDPERILVLMFNRAARTDFASKLQQQAAGRFSRLPEIRTYHAMGLRLYRNFVRKGILPPFVDPLLGEQEIHWQLWRHIQQCAPQAMSHDLKSRKTEWVELAAALLDRKKTTLRPMEEVFNEMGIRPELRFLQEAIVQFEAWRTQSRRISFADMLHEPVKAIEKDPGVKSWVADKMDMVLVDEYQDTNEIQHLLLKAIAGTRAKVTVVGDPDQTIYEFRGASPDFILNRFAEDFRSPTHLTLTYSFRYGPDVAGIANQMICHNKGRKEQQCRAHPDNPDTRVNLITTHAQTRSLMEALRKRLQQAGQLADTAVLFRVWSQAVPVELACLAEGFDYRIEPGKGALNNPDVKQIIYLLELAAGRFTTHAPEQRYERFYGLLKFPHAGLKDDVLQQTARKLAYHEQRWGDHLLDASPDDLHALQRFKLKRCARLWNSLVGQTNQAATIIREYVAEAELFRGMQDLALTREGGEERINIVKQMIGYLESLKVTPQQAVEHFSQLARRAAEKTEGDGLTLATIHKTKGLEWSSVFVLGLSERYLPYTYQGTAPDEEEKQLESERRLLYVAITRCKQELTLLAPVPDAKNTDPESTPSRFVAEMGYTIEKKRSILALPSRRNTPKIAKKPTEKAASPKGNSLFFD
jgi:DNA helicase-2/ATP-dependent DNA helicase PcrA